MKNSTNIPALLCEYALVSRRINQLKLYIYLKMISDGYVPYNSCSPKVWGRSINVHDKTVKSSLQWLIRNKWITVNSKKRVLKIISFEHLMKKLNLNIRTGYVINLDDLMKFKPLCCAIVITYYLNRKRYFDRRSGSNRGNSIMNRFKRNNGFYSMPNKYIAKCMNVSISTAYRYKQEAEDAGYIETKQNRSILETEQGEKIKVEDYHIIRREISIKGSPNRLKKRKNYLTWEESTLIKSFIKCKKKDYTFSRKN